MLEQKKKREKKVWGPHEGGNAVLRKRNVGHAHISTVPKLVDPKNRVDALRQDEVGWKASENRELLGHLKNGTFTVIDRSKVPSGKKLVRFTWVYTWKRDGTQKSRLCV